MDVFAPPGPRRVPDATWWTPARMGSTFRVGAHRVDVETHHVTGEERYLVDGIEVLARRHLGWHAEVALPVGEHQVLIRSRWYPLLPVEVWVDGRRALDDLFPQQSLGLVLIGLPASAAALAFGASIVRDLWGLALLLR